MTTPRSTVPPFLFHASSLSVDSSVDPMSTMSCWREADAGTMSERAHAISALLAMAGGTGLIRNGFHRSGGLIESDEVASQLRRRGESKPLSRVAHWIVDRDVVSLVWSTRILLPRFQFDEQTMTPRQDAMRVVHELRDVFDDIALADWFASPNSWLDGAAPAEALRGVPHHVYEAARADRFVLHG